MTKLASSPDRGTFGIEGLIKRAQEKGLDPATDEHTQTMIKFKTDWIERAEEQERNPEWAKDNLEYDLRTCEWVIEKCRAREEYAQNLYAAMCNRQFQKIDVMPILRDQRWSCSWRYAGGIVADLRGQGDYIDWYCSGIAGGDEPDVYLEGADLKRKGYVPESVVTEEIANDLQKLGWQVLDIDHKD